MRVCQCVYVCFHVCVVCVQECASVCIRVCVLCVSGGTSIHVSVNGSHTPSAPLLVRAQHKINKLTIAMHLGKILADI